MKIIDTKKTLRNLYNGDFVIIGAGIIGIFLTFLLKKKKFKIILIERGNNKKNSVTEKRTISRSLNHNASQSNQGFILGGNSKYWGGQLSEFREEDIKKNFWGLNFLKLKSLYNEIYKILKIKCNNKITYNSKYKLGFYFTYFLKNPDLFKYFSEKLKKNKNIILLSNLTAQKIIFEGKTVKQIQCKSINGKKITVVGKKFIFCQGTIENIRFLLTNKAIIKNSPLKKLNHIGNYFQDHMEVYFGTLKVYSKKKFSELFENRVNSDLLHQPKICNFIQNSNQASMCMGFIGDSHRNKIAEESKQILKNFRYNPGIKSFFSLFKIKYLKYNLIYIIYFLKFKKIKMFFKNNIRTTITCEQIPTVNSKIVINKKKLQDGLFQAVLFWKVRGIEFYEMQNFIDKLNTFFLKMGIGKLNIKKFLYNKKLFFKNIKDTNHASGGLIISKNFKTGVCNKNCKVWGISNLYIAGSALFPNSGHSNVTLTAMALALKLSKHLLKKKV